MVRLSLACFRGSRGVRVLMIGLVALAVAGGVRASTASDAAYEAGRRHVAACDYDAGLALLDRAARADPDSPSGHRARLLQLLVLNAQVGRSLSALGSYDRGMEASSAAAVRRQRRAVVEEGAVALRHFLRACQGFRQHLPSREECRIELPLPDRWTLAVLNSAEQKIEAGRVLAPGEMAAYKRHGMRVWVYMSMSQFYCRPGKDDDAVAASVTEALTAGETVDPWTVLATTIDSLAAVVNRSLIDGEEGRARVVHQELRSCVSTLLLKSRPDESVVARTKAEASVKQVFGPERGAEWFHDLEFATRLVRARQ